MCKVKKVGLQTCVSQVKLDQFYDLEKRLKFLNENSVQ